jgi:hypothetical protein
MGEGEAVYRVLVRRPKGKRPLGGLRFSLEDNIRMDLRKIEIDGGSRIGWVRIGSNGRLR